MSGTNTIREIVINKRLANEEWANVYHIALTSGSVEEDIVDAIVTAERALAPITVEFVNYVSRPFPGPGEGTPHPLGLAGLNQAVELLPLFNVLRVDFPAPTGRPSRKYYRAALTPDHVDGNNILASAWQQLQTELINDFAAVPAGALVDVDGQALGGPVLARSVGMRQLRRGSKRKTTP